jgi:hypothetical protein
MVDLNNIATIQVIEVNKPDVGATVVDVSTNSLPIAEVIVTTETIAGPAITQIDIPGLQGPPGLQNVRVQTLEPENPNLNDIWIQI